jgi:hypothetical protein
MELTGLTWKKSNMTLMTGIVEAVSTKEVSTKFGVKPTWSLKVNGTWVKAGFKDPKTKAGDEVEFDGVTTTYGLETKTVNIIKVGTGVVPVAAPVVTSSTVTAVPKTSYARADKVFPIPPLHGDRSIVRQNALARATDLYIGARGGKPFEFDVASLDLVISFARKFEAYTAGDLDMAQAVKENEDEAAAAST